MKTVLETLSLFYQAAKKPETYVSRGIRRIFLFKLTMILLLFFFFFGPHRRPEMTPASVSSALIGATASQGE